MKRAIIVHGFKGKPKTNWKPWLKRELESADYSVDIPEMPNTDHPTVNEWVGKLNGTVGSFVSDEIYLIGHSLGCITILKYLETLGENQKVKACIFVAGFTREFKEYTGGHDTFFENELTWSDIKKHSENFIAIHSKDDQNVGFEELAEFTNHLNARTIAAEGMGHFGSADGVYEVPIALEAILALK